MLISSFPDAKTGSTLCDCTIFCHIMTLILECSLSFSRYEKKRIFCSFSKTVPTPADARYSPVVRDKSTLLNPNIDLDDGQYSMTNTGICCKGRFLIKKW